MASAAPPANELESAAALCARALSLRHRDPAAARELARRAVDALDGEPGADARLRRRALATLGACLSTGTAADVARGRELLRDALAASEAAGDDPLRGKVLNELAASHISTSEHEAAADHARRALALARDAGRRDDQARALGLLGTALCGTGDFVASLPALLEALALHEAAAGERVAELPDELRWERGELLSRIAVVYSNLGQYERALGHYRAALESFGDRFPESTARTLYRIAIAAEELRDMEMAERHYRASLDAYERQGNAAGAALGRVGLSKLRLRRGEVDDAEAFVRRGLADLAGDPVYLSFYADALWVLGDVHLARDHADEALACYHEAHALFEKTGRPDEHLAWLVRRISRACAAAGRYEEALRHHERFYELRVRHLEEQSTARMAAMMAQFDTERAMKDREIHRLRSIELEREIAERKEAEAALARAQAELEERNRELHALSIRDPLTGAFNRRYLDQRMAEAMPLAVRGIQPLSVMMCDVDDFKRINDTYLHAVGDEVLRTVAEILARHLRQSDVVARFGGEEFVVLFPATTLEQAVAASEKVCALVRGHDWSALHPELAVTLSAGVAEAGAHPTHEKLLADADARLYEAKRRGKDCVVG